MKGVGLMKFLLAIIDAISEFTGKFFSFLVLALALLMTAEVIMRYVFNSPIMGVHDIMCAYFGAYFMMTGAYALYRQEHVKVDLIYTRFSARGQATLDLITFPFFLIFVGAIVYTGWNFGLFSVWVVNIGWIWEVDQSHLRLPIYPMKWTIFIGGTLLLLQGLAKFIRDLNLVITGKELK